MIRVLLVIHMPPHDVWTNFTTGTTAYNTSTVAEYNVVAADKYNQSIDAIGFMDAGFGGRASFFYYWGGRNYGYGWCKQLGSTQSPPALETGMTVSSMPLDGRSACQPPHTLPRHRSGAF